MNKLPLALLLLVCVPSFGQWIPTYSSQPVDSVTETIIWTTAVSSTEQVQYGTTTPLRLFSPTNTTMSTSHSVMLTGLLDGVTYYWRPISKDVYGVPVTGQLAKFTTAPIVVTVTPATATVTSGQSQQFTATVSGVPNHIVTWSASAGSITTSGLFTAPSVTTQTSVTVTAASTMGSQRAGSATVTVTATAPAGHSVTLNWTDSSPVTFNVYRGQVSGGPYSAIATALTNTNYVDATVVSGQTYYYVVTAVNSSGLESTYSNQVQAVIP